MATPTLRTGAYVEFLRFNIGQKLGAVTGDLLFFSGEEFTLLSPGAAGEVILSAGPGNPPTFGPAPMGAIPDPLALNRLNANEIGFNTGTDVKLKAPFVLDFAGTNLFWGNGSGAAITTGTGNTVMGMNSLPGVTTESDNTAVGESVLTGLIGGERVTAVGHLAGATVVAENDLIFMGDGADIGIAGAIEAVIIGNGAVSIGSSVTIGHNTKDDGVAPESLNVVIGHNIDSIDSYESVIVGCKRSGGNGLGNGGEIGQSVVLGAGAGGADAAATPSIFGNVILGWAAGNRCVFTEESVIIGWEAGNTGDYYNCVLVGSVTGQVSTGINLFAVTAIGDRAGQNNNTDENTYLGYTAGNSAVNATEICAIGAYAGSNILGSENTSVGYFSLYGVSAVTTTGARNTSVGNRAGQDIRQGDDNTLIGSRAAENITDGNRNVIIGSTAGAALGTENDSVMIGFGVNAGFGQDSVIIGSGASGNFRDTVVGRGASGGNSSTAIGYNTSAANTSIVIGRDTTSTTSFTILIGNATTLNTARGVSIGYDVGGSGATCTYVGNNIAPGSTGANNVGFGIDTLSSLIAGASNVAMGNSAGATLVGGDNNVLIGNGADVSAAVSNCVIIGTGSSTTDGSIVIGDGTVVDTDTINIGIGNNTTNARDAQVIGHLSGAGIFSTTIGWLADPNGLSNQSVHIGHLSGRSVTGGFRNTAVGVGSLNQAATPSNNVAIGDFTLSSAAVGNNNTALGSQAGGNASATRSVWVGAYPAGGSQNGNDSVYIGYSAAIYSSPATIDSIYIGSSSGVTAGPGTPLTGPGNIVIGTRANVNTLATTESMVIGNDALGSDNSISIGNNTNAGSTSCVVIGEGASCTMINTVVIGQGASSVSPSDTVIGQGATSLVANATVIGQGASAGIGSTQSTIIGSTATSTGSDCSILGFGATSTANNSTVVGFGASSTAVNGIAIGSGATVTVADSCQIGPAVVSGGAVMSFRTQTVSDEAWIGGGETSLIIDNNGNMNRAVDDLPVAGNVGTKYTFSTAGTTPTAVETFTVSDDTVRRIEVKCVGRGTVAPFLNSVFSARSDALIKNDAGTITTHVTQEIQISDVLATIEYNIGVGEVTVRIIGIGGLFADWTVYILTFTG